MDTVFSPKRFVPWGDTGFDLDINVKILKDIVANSTIAVMLGSIPLKVTNATVDANTTTYHNVYSFSRPINLVLPYFLSLVRSLPFLVFGYFSLRGNCVAALSDSFLQLSVTITRGEELDRMVRPCELGGDEMATESSKRQTSCSGNYR